VIRDTRYEFRISQGTQCKLVSSITSLADVQCPYVMRDGVPNTTGNFLRFAMLRKVGRPLASKGDPTSPMLCHVRRDTSFEFLRGKTSIE